MSRPAVELGGLRIDPPIWLAPMEGITDRSFRALILDTNPGAVGATCTEFVRVSDHPFPVEKLAHELGPARKDAPVGIQLMGNQPDIVAATAAHAVEAGAKFVDLNFGCPAPRVLQHCAGSALLDRPNLLGELIQAVVAAVEASGPGVPVTAKIRAGGEDDARVEELAQRVEQAGADALCVHGRLRTEKYTDPTDWRRITRAVGAVSIPVIGNGSAETPAGIDAMFEETGCAGVMVGRAALADPWIFSRWAALQKNGGAKSQESAPVSRAERTAWLHTYATAMETSGATPIQALGRLKQAVKYMTNAGHLEPAAGLAQTLRGQSATTVFEALGPSSGEKTA